MELVFKKNYLDYNLVRCHFKAATGPAEQDQQKELVGAALEEPG